MARPGPNASAELILIPALVQAKERVVSSNTNADVTMTLSRLPEGPEPGPCLGQLVCQRDRGRYRWPYDRTGPLGTCTTITPSNLRRRVDVAVAGEAQPATAVMI